MSEEVGGKVSSWERFKTKLRHTYRLVIMNNETFEEVGSHKLSLLNFYVLLSSVLLVVTIIVVSLIAYTPIKRYIPGVGANYDAQATALKLSTEVDRLERELRAYQKQSESVRRMLVGDVQTVSEVTPPAENQAIPLDDSISADAAEVDRLLRTEVELQETGVIAQTNRTSTLTPRDVPLEQVYFMAPVKGVISAGFKPDEKHYGVDILAPKNTAIKAAMDGVVIFSDWTVETGNTIGIQHSNNIVTFYKHNSQLLKEEFAFVKAGEAIAIIGNTGTLSDGPHLHFELWHKGKPVDPKEYIEF